MEIEAKLRVTDRAALEAALVTLGAAPGPTEHETNTLFDDAKGSLTRRGEVLRVRETEGRGLLTLKGTATVSRGVKSRVEMESEVASGAAVRDILSTLRFEPTFFYEKRRTVWRFADSARPVVTVDETPIGLFAEIEGTEDAVRALAAELGIPERELLHESYVALYRKERERDPTLPADMRFRS